MEVLTGKGAGSDEVLRQIFDVTNKGGTPGELALRFDLTVPLARFVAKHVNELGVPFKRYAIGSVFRGERPAKGRFREFVQCDFDTVGTESPVADAETAQVIHAALAAAGVPAFTITLNNRKILDGLLDTPGRGRQDGPGPPGPRQARQGRPRQGARRAPARRAGRREHRRSGTCCSRQTRRSGCSTSSSRDAAASKSWRRPRSGSAGTRGRPRGSPTSAPIFELLDAAGVPQTRLQIDLGLARGLDYYTGVVFETTVNGWERFGSISSGGRYDNLASLFTDRRLPGVGASIGLDRLLALMEEAGWLKGAATTAAGPGGELPGRRPRPSRCSLPPGSGPRASAPRCFPSRSRSASRWATARPAGTGSRVIVGPDEHARQLFNLRNLATRQEEKAIPWAELETRVNDALRAIEGTGG